MAAGRWLALCCHSRLPAAGGNAWYKALDSGLRRNDVWILTWARIRFLPALKQAPGRSVLFLPQARHEFDQIAGAGALIKLVADEFIPGRLAGAR